jgi:uncharacterized protein (DUF58 family)
MLTHRGWWFFVFLLGLLTLGLVLESSSTALIALTLLTWFLGQWLVFACRIRLIQDKVSVRRDLIDERGAVDTLWARVPAGVRVSLHYAGAGTFPFVSMIDRVPVLVQRREGDWFAEGALAADLPLETTYRIECPAPGRLRFDGVKVRIADLHGFFGHQSFLRDLKVYRVLPALADARGRVPSAKRHNLIPLIGSHPHRRPGSGSELLDLRDYLPGDPPKMIAWKASARRDRLMTKEFESEVPVRCTLFVDTSNSVRVGTVGSNALARLVEIAAAITQANASAHDLTGLCLFDETGVQRLVRPRRGASHVALLTNLLADAADLFPRTDDVPVARLLPLAYGLLQDLYPDWLDGEVNSWPFWLPFWAPQPWYTIPGPPWKARWWWAWPVVALLRILLRFRPWALLGNLVGAFSPRKYRWRKQVAAVLSVQYDLGPGGLALLLEDDELCSRYLQRFLVDHQVPCPLPYYDGKGRYLFGAPGKIDVLAGGLMRAVLHGRDNELFVLLVDFLESGPHLEKILRAVRVALGRHHQVIVVCPWPAGIEVPSRQGGGRTRAAEDTRPSLQDLLTQASKERIELAFAQVQQGFARLGVPVLCAPEEETVGLILHRMHRLRAQQRGVR